MTASNLFKFAFPCHSLILFKHHQPLEFSSNQICDLLNASSEWFQKASQEHPEAKWPLFLWNCLPRAGASQFHGHAQVTLTNDPTPEALQLRNFQSQFQSVQGQNQYFEAIMEAHSEVGLRRSLTGRQEQAHCCVSLAPRKDMELILIGKNLSSPIFGFLLYNSLRCLIDKLGVTSFNVGILNIKLTDKDNNDDDSDPIIARIVSRGSLASKASDFGGLEVFGGASIGHTDPYTIIKALDSQFQDIQDKDFEWKRY